MYHCKNNEGVTVASYANLSECETYWLFSVYDGPAEFLSAVRDGEITVFDKTKSEVGSIKLPKSSCE